MKTALLLTLLKESALSPEELGKSLGLSGMTLRRWMKRGPRTTVPKFYERAFADEILSLHMEGRLGADSEAVRWAMAEGRNLYFKSALRNLGLEENFLDQGGGDDRLMLGLTRIGSDEAHRKEVDANRQKILDFGGLSREWTKRITTLVKVLKSAKLASLDKLVAYGALFYLLCPFDFVPDSIPVFGLMDDYAILGLAAGYYLKRYSDRI